MFKLVVVFCTSIALLTTIDQFFDGPTQKLSEEEWKINHNWDWHWHKVIDAGGYTFAPIINDWSGRVDNTMALTYSPIFRAGKKSSYDIEQDNSKIRRHEELRWRSVFSWFPAFQLFLLLPLIPFLFKRKSAWFNFARLGSIFFVFPLSILLLFVALL